MITPLQLELHYDIPPNVPGISMGCDICPIRNIYSSTKEIRQVSLCSVVVALVDNYVYFDWKPRNKQNVAASSVILNMYVTFLFRSHGYIWWPKCNIYLFSTQLLQQYAYFVEHVLF